MSYPHQDYRVDETSADYYGSKKFAVTALSARITAMVSLIVAIAVFQTNDAKIDTGYVYTYHDFLSYKYAFWVALMGVGYTVLQVPFSIHYVLTKKHMINSYAFLKLHVYADKVVTFVVAMAAGMAFGATMELKNKNNVGLYDEDRMQDFLTVAYIPAAFLLVGSIASGISSFHSSLALIAIRQ